MIQIYPETLVVGLDKWSLEKYLNFDFFWYSRPFEHSKSKGFIIPSGDFIVKIPFVTIVDVEESFDCDFFSFDLSKTIFYSEEWLYSASKIASFIKNIVCFKEAKADIVKQNYKILGKTPCF